MHQFTWILQGLVATALFLSGLLILILPKARMAERMSWVNHYSDTMRIFICSAKILGALGLMLPMYTGILPILTPLAAVGIAVFMVLAIRYHIQQSEWKEIPAPSIFLGLAVCIAAIRF